MGTCKCLAHGRHFKKKKATKDKKTKQKQQLPVYPPLLSKESNLPLTEGPYLMHALFVLFLVIFLNLSFIISF